MFTGIIESKGKINQIVENSEGLTLFIQVERNKMNLSIGESIAVNGVCLTVISFEKNIFLVDVVKETLSKTNISAFKLNHEVNLERPLKASGSFGGHIVLGHIDFLGCIQNIIPVGLGVEMRIELPQEQLKYCAPKGSIAIEGISLTIAKIIKNTIVVAIIPHTLQMTNLGQKNINDMVNVEVDILGKYVESLFHGGKNV